MIVLHVAVTACEGAGDRREPHRAAHIERAIALRREGWLIGGGPTPDARGAELFVRVAEPDQLGSLVEEDPYYRAGVWTAYASRSFSQFVEPWEIPPVVLDGSRRVVIVEGVAADPDMAQFVLIELRGGGRLAFGGLLDGAATVAVMRSAEPAEATEWLAETGFWARDGLTARALLHVL